MKLFNWGKTEEQKEIEKREAFENNLKLLEKDLQELNFEFKEKELFHKFLIDRDGDLFFIREFYLPTYEDVDNYYIKCLLTNKFHSMTEGGEIRVRDVNHFLDYCMTSKNRYMSLKKQFKNFGYEINKIKNNE